MRTLLITLSCTLFVFSSYGQTKKNWTIMHYSAGSNSSERDLMSDIEEMKQGKKSDDYNLITLIDRIEGFSSDSFTLDGNFTDTRLYQINHNSFTRLDGKEVLPEIKLNGSYEANMADGKVLKRFIQYCKKYYPANNYMLILRSHGNGVGMCPDAEGGKMDRLYPSEISGILSAEESVDILGLDLCSMAGLENLYEWRPNTGSFSADYVLASSPLSGAWAYDAILNRIGTIESARENPDTSYFEGGEELNPDPNTMSPMDFSLLIMEEIYDNQRWASWGLFDNSKIDRVKSTIDHASRMLYAQDTSLIFAVIRNTLGYHHNTSNNTEVSLLTFPYIDAYHFWYQIEHTKGFDARLRAAAGDVCRTIDELVVHSYYGRGYLPESNDFVEGKSGVYQIVPRGSNIYTATQRSFWNHCGWFHPDDRSEDDNSYGQYDWCINGAIRGNNEVENFYELLDYLFDESNDESGGVNGYAW